MLLTLTYHLSPREPKQAPQSLSLLLVARLKDIRSRCLMDKYKTQVSGHVAQS